MRTSNCRLAGHMVPERVLKAQFAGKHASRWAPINACTSSGLPGICFRVGGLHTEREQLSSTEQRWTLQALLLDLLGGSLSASAASLSVIAQPLERAGVERLCDVGLVATSRLQAGL